MTRKDYITLAACIEGAFSASALDMERHAVRDVAARIALELKLDNPRFDRARFSEACGFGAFGTITRGVDWSL